MAKFKILSSNTSIESAMKFRTALEERLGLEPKTILVSKNSNHCQEVPVLLRYGCGYGKLNPEPEWNSPTFINDFCIDKKTFSDSLREVVPAPQFFNREIPREFPVLIRETLSGTKSGGVITVDNEQEFMSSWNPAFWWTPYYFFDFELRVYLVITSDKYSMRIYKKIPEEGVDTEGTFITRADDDDNTGWYLRNNKYYPKVKAIVEKLVPVFWEKGGRFVGLDMIYVPALKTYVTLEGNSGPWLSKANAEWLAGEFVNSQWQKFRGFLNA